MKQFTNSAVFGEMEHSSDACDVTAGVVQKRPWLCEFRSVQVGIR